MNENTEPEKECWAEHVDIIRIGNERLTDWDRERARQKKIETE